MGKKIDKDTQTREYYKNLEKARRREKLQRDTDKVERGVAKALFKFDVHTLKGGVDKAIEYAEKALKVAESINKRQEELAQAEQRALSARAATYAKNSGK